MTEIFSRSSPAVHHSSVEAQIFCLFYVLNKFCAAMAFLSRNSIPRSDVYIHCCNVELSGQIHNIFPQSNNSERCPFLFNVLKKTAINPFVLLMFPSFFRRKKAKQFYATQG